jgi:hypothetical protein
LIATTGKTILSELSVSDSRRLIRVEVLQIGQFDFRATVNERPIALPSNLPTIEDARKVAVELAIKEISSSIGELISTYLD